MANSMENHEGSLSIVDCNAMLTSAVCHLVAMIALGVVFAVGQEDAEPLSLLASPADAPIALQETASLSVEPPEDESEADKAAATAGSIRLFDVPAIATADLAPFAHPSLLEISAIESGRDGSAFGDVGDSTGHFARGASKFFGVSGYGQTFVYVVDCSGSMRDNGKLQRAKYELLQSIDQLSADQKYFVYFYNNNAIPMEGNAPIEANGRSIARTRLWVDMVQADGGTNPLPALLAALSLKPDAIFFLSDGLFDGSTNVTVRASNGRRNGRVPIHSIAFVNRENLGLMRAIARDSGGEFRFVK
jgi:hypothetical protein